MKPTVIILAWLPGFEIKPPARRPFIVAAAFWLELTDAFRAQFELRARDDAKRNDFLRSA